AANFLQMQQTRSASQPSIVSAASAPCVLRDARAAGVSKDAEPRSRRESPGHPYPVAPSSVAADLQHSVVRGRTKRHEQAAGIANVGAGRRGYRGAAMAPKAGAGGRT